MQAHQHPGPAQPTTPLEFGSPLVVVLAGRRTIIDPDVLAPLLWASDEQQLAALDAIRGAGL